MSELKNFCETFQIKYTPVEIIGLDEKGKKIFRNNIRQFNNIKNMTYDECIEKIKTIK